MFPCKGLEEKNGAEVSARQALQVPLLSLTHEGPGSHLWQVSPLYPVRSQMHMKSSQDWIQRLSCSHRLGVHLGAQRAPVPAPAQPPSVPLSQAALLSRSIPVRDAADVEEHVVVLRQAVLCQQLHVHGLHVHVQHLQAAVESRLV